MRMTENYPSSPEAHAISEIGPSGHVVPEHPLEISEHTASDVPGVLIFDREGRMVSATANVDGYFRDLGALDSRWREDQDLPLPVQAVLGALERSRSQPSEHEQPRLPRLRTRARSGRWLVLHAAETAETDDRPSERVVVIAPAETEDGAWFAVVGYELGSRTAEVVRSLVRGLSTLQSAGVKLLNAGLRALRAPLEHEPREWHFADH
jgi:hypothetical protein